MRISIETLQTVPAGHEETWVVEDHCESIPWDAFVWANVDSLTVGDFEDIFNSLTEVGDQYIFLGVASPMTRITLVEL